LPPGAIMDSLRQPFPAGLSSKPAWVTSPLSCWRDLPGPVSAVACSVSAGLTSPRAPE
ncbi:hypothetical protein KUCAC02_027235, partial [Chaenocephalus aceratus]